MDGGCATAEQSPAAILLLQTSANSRLRTRRIRCVRENWDWAQAGAHARRPRVAGAPRWSLRSLWAPPPCPCFPGSASSAMLSSLSYLVSRAWLVEVGGGRSAGCMWDGRRMVGSALSPLRHTPLATSRQQQQQQDGHKMTPDLSCLMKSLRDTADLPDLLGSTRLAESFTDIPGSFPSSLPMGSTGNGPKPAPQEA